MSLSLGNLTAMFGVGNMSTLPVIVTENPENKPGRPGRPGGPGRPAVGDQGSEGERDWMIGTSVSHFDGRWGVTVTVANRNVFPTRHFAKNVSRGRGGQKASRVTRTSSLFSIKDTVSKYVVSPIACIGFLANCLAFVVFQRKPLRNVPSVYFSTIAVADNFVLGEYAGSTYILYQMNEALYTTHVFLCKAMKWLKQFGPTWSAWIIVAMTVERLIAISLPLKTKSWITRCRAITTVSMITFLLCVIWVFFAFGQLPSICAKDLQDGPYEEIDRQLYLALYTGIPSPLLIILNGILLFRVVKAMKARGRLTAEKPVVLSRKTISTIVVSLVYLILTIPSYGLGYYKTYILGNEVPSQGTIVSSEVFKLLHYINHAISFFLYLYLIPKFRMELRALCLLKLKTTRRSLGSRSAAGSFTFSCAAKKEGVSQDL